MKHKKFTDEQDRVFKYLSKTIIETNENNGKVILNNLFSLRVSPDKHENKIYEDFSWMNDDEWLTIRNRVEEEYSILLK